MITYITELGAQVTSWAEGLGRVTRFGGNLSAALL